MRTPRVPLADLVTSVGGGTPDRKNATYWGPGIPWASVKDLNDGDLSRTQESITESGLLASASHRIEPGAVIVATRVGLGKVAVNSIPVALNQDLRALRCNESLDSRYLLHFLRSRAPLMVSMGEGATVKGVTIDKLLGIGIPLPPVPEQRRMASILDNTDAIRRKRREAIELANAWPLAAFMKRFGSRPAGESEWPQATIGDVADIQGGLQVTSKRSTLPIEAPYLRVANVYRDRLRLDEVKMIRLTPDELDRTKLARGDVLVVEGHGNSEEIGRAAVWDGSIEMCTHQNHLIRVRPRAGGATPAFLCACLNAPAGRAQMTVFCKTTSGLNTISASNVRAIRIPLPPIGLQEKYGEIRARVATLETKLGDAAAEAEALYASVSVGFFA